MKKSASSGQLDAAAWMNLLNLAEHRTGTSITISEGDSVQNKAKTHRKGNAGVKTQKAK